MTAAIERNYYKLGRDWSTLEDRFLRFKILSKLIPESYNQVCFIEFLQRPIIESGLKNVALVSKKWLKIASELKQEWVNRNAVSLCTYGCKSVEDAILCIRTKNLSSANLVEFDTTEENIKVIIQDFPYINHLIFYSRQSIQNCPIERLTQLKTLYLGENYPLWDSFVSALRNNPHLEHLSLSRIDNQLANDRMSELLGLLKGLSHLKTLDLSFLNIKENELLVLMTHFQLLTSLRLNYCWEIKGDTLVKLVKALPILENLCLDNLMHIPEEKIAEAIKSATNLRGLSFYACSRMQGDKLATAIALHPNLKYLNFALCSDLVGGRLLKEIQNLQNLSYLIFAHCKQIPQDELVEVILNLPNLKYVDIQSTQINELDCDKIKRAKPHLTFILSSY